MRSKNYKIRAQMDKLKLIQSELTNLAVISSTTRLSRIINNLISPTRPEVERLSAVLKCEPEDIGLDLEVNSEKK